MNRLLLACIMVVLLLTLVAAAYQTNVIYVGAQQTVTLICKGDEFLTTIVSKREIVLTCRVWVR
jgi:hypothetical protein